MTDETLEQRLLTELVRLTGVRRVVVPFLNEPRVVLHVADAAVLSTRTYRGSLWLLDGSVLAGRYAGPRERAVTLGDPDLVERLREVTASLGLPDEERCLP